MAARKDPSEKKDTEVVGATFSAVTVRRLDALVKDGSYGVTRPEVIRHFLEEGLRQARKDNFISADDWA